MKRKGLIAALGVFGFLLLALVVGAIAADAQYQRTYGDQTVDNERVIVDTNNDTAVEAADYTNNFDTSVTVRLDGEQLNGSGDDYTWLPATGELSWNASSPQISDGGTAEVSYGYTGRPLAVEETRGVRQMLFSALPWLLLLIVPLALLGLFATLYRNLNGSKRRER